MNSRPQQIQSGHDHHEAYDVRQAQGAQIKIIGPEE